MGAAGPAGRGGAGERAVPAGRPVGQSDSAYIATDGFFSLAVLVAGLVSGVLAWRLARAHGPAVVPALAAAGLAAAYVAMRVGEAVDDDRVRSAVLASQERVDLPLQLGAVTSLALWPGVALIAWVACTYLRDRRKG